jgi:hypothetical protein
MEEASNVSEAVSNSLLRKPAEFLFVIYGIIAISVRHFGDTRR